jgi:uncharacterized protein YdaU (DUF1376 family)
MSGRPWYKRYGADFVHGCLGLTLEEKGAYSLCLDLIYDRGGPIPDDARWLAGVCGVSLRKWASLRGRLIEAGKLVERDGRLSNIRAEKEIEAAAKTAQKLAESGAKGGEKRAENARSLSNNNDVGQASLKHTRINQIPEAREDRSDADASDAGSASSRPVQDDGWPADYRARFWSAYPNKVGKDKALPLLDRIRKSRRVSFDKLMSGLDAYIASKPPDRQWCNPATWLNQGRWDDEPSIAAPQRSFGQHAQHDLAVAFDKLKDHAQRMEDVHPLEAGWGRQ